MVPLLYPWRERTTPLEGRVAWLILLVVVSVPVCIVFYSFSLPYR